jgi:hypothetical protein
MAKAGDEYTVIWRRVTRSDGSQAWRWVGIERPPVKKLFGKAWVPIAYERRAGELFAMGITGASEALAKESKTAPDCAKPLKARYIEKLLRERGMFVKARRNSPKQRQK